MHAEVLPWATDLSSVVSKAPAIFLLEHRQTEMQLGMLYLTPAAIQLAWDDNSLFKYSDGLTDQNLHHVSSVTVMWSFITDTDLESGNLVISDT